MNTAVQQKMDEKVKQTKGASSQTVNAPCFISTCLLNDILREMILWQKAQ